MKDNGKTETKRDVMIVRVRVGDMTGVAVTPSYLFDQDVVRVWIPELDECRIGEVVGDYRTMSRAKAEIIACTYGQRFPLMEVRGKYDYEEFRR